MRKRLAASVVLVALVIGGCTAHPPSSASTPSPSKTGALGALLPVFPTKLTAATAKTTTVDAADSIQGLVAKQDIVYVDNHAKLVPATSSAGGYYGVLRTITVDKTLDPLEQAEAMEKLLVAAGWIERDTATDKGKYLAAMSSDADGAKSWFLLLGGDSTNAKSPVVTVQVASPDLTPAK